MIFIDKQITDVSKIGEVLGITIPLDLLKKKPLFEINPALIKDDSMNNGAGSIRHRNGMSFPAHFQATLTNKGNKVVEIRYATSDSPDERFMGQARKYGPKSLDFDGKAKLVQDLDQAVYFWLHFFNKQTPFRNPRVPFEYQLVDDSNRANEIIKMLTLRNEATAHAQAMEGEDLKLTAKGLNIPGASDMDEISIKAQLMQYANNKPEEYLQRVGSTVTQIEGLIRDSIDREVFVLEHGFNIKKWVWGKGPHKGQLITELSSAVMDDKSALLTFITEKNLNAILPVLLAIGRQDNIDRTMESTGKGINIADYITGKTADVPNIPPIKTSVENTGKDSGSENDDDIDLPPMDNSAYLPLPTDFPAAKEYLKKHLGKQNLALASALYKGVTDGSINADNIGDKIAEYGQQ